MKALVTGIVDLRFGIADDHLEVSAVLVLSAHAFCIFLEFRGVIGPRKQIFEEDGMWDADRPKILHRRSQHAGVDVLVSLKLDLTDLDLGPFLHNECKADSRRGDLPQ